MGQVLLLLNERYCPPTDETLSVQAVEVYEKLVHDDPNDPPDLVIGGKMEAIHTVLLVC